MNSELDDTNNALGDQTDIEHLTHLLGERDRETSQSAIDSLVHIGKPAINSLINALRHKDRWFNAVEALVRIGSPAVDPLIQVLKDESIDSFSFDALSRIGEPAVLPLIASLEDQDVSARCWAIQTLGWIGDARSIESLTKALQDPDISVRQCAAEALDKMGSR